MNIFEKTENNKILHDQINQIGKSFTHAFDNIKQQEKVEKMKNTYAFDNVKQQNKEEKMKIVNVVYQIENFLFSTHDTIQYLLKVLNNGRTISLKIMTENTKVIFHSFLS